MTSTATTQSATFFFYLQQNGHRDLIKMTRTRVDGEFAYTYAPGDASEFSSPTIIVDTLDEAELYFARRTYPDHEFSVTRKGSGWYLTCCGDDISFYTSGDWGIRGTAGWYITDTAGNMSERSDTLADAKAWLERRHRA